MEQNIKADFSCLLFSTLDTFGYDQDSISFRSNIFDKMSRLVDTRCAGEVTLVISGSTGEGVGLMDSDLDSMFVSHDSVCVENGREMNGFNVFETDFLTCPPGYTKVVPIHIVETSALCNLLLTPDMYITSSGITYLSSALFKSNHQKLIESVKCRTPEDVTDDITSNGPATTRKLQPARWVYPDNGINEHDMVMCIFFYGKTYLDNWAARARHFRWPSKEIIQEISNMEGYIAPIGDKRSENQNTEWRICYTTAEKKLVSSLNAVQMKLYVLLKLIAKQILKPVCKEITSYVIKNVVFWSVETQPANHFSPATLANLVLKSLQFLKQCLLTNHLPNYMMPERNMLAVVHGKAKQRTIHILSTCLDDGIEIFLKIPKLRKCILFTCTSPERERFMTHRKKVEKAMNEFTLLEFELFEKNMISSSNFILDIYLKGMRDERYHRALVNVLNMIVPEWLCLAFAGKFFELGNLFDYRLGHLRQL